MSWLLLILISSLSGMTKSREKPSHITNNFFADSYDLDNQNSTTIEAIVPKIERSIILHGISAVETAENFGLQLINSLSYHDDHHDKLAIMANFTIVRPELIVKLSISVLIFEHFKFLQVTTFNISSTHHTLNEFQNINIDHFNHVCLLKQFKVSNMPYMLRVVSNLGETLYDYDVFASHNLTGWVVIDIVVIKQQVLVQCNSIVQMYHQREEVDIHQKILFADVSHESAHLIGMARMAGTELKANFSDLIGHIEVGEFDVGLIKLNMTCIRDKFGERHPKAIEMEVINRSVQSVGTDIGGVVLCTFVIITIVLLFYLLRKRSYATLVEENVDVGSVRHETFPTQTERQIANLSQIREKCGLCQLVPSDAQLIPCAHAYFCSRCIAKLKAEQEQDFSCPGCHIKVQRVHIY